MPCEHYKNALIEAAASGSEPQGELHAHLAACAACHSTFAQEQALFSSIDASLHVTANAEVPASLLPRVRARLDVEATPNRSWVTNWLVLATGAGVLVTLFAVRAGWRTNVVQKPVETTVKISVPPRATPQQNHDSAVTPPAVKNSGSQRQDVVAKNYRAHETLAVGKTMPEVLVPRDQELLLAEYAEQWSLHKHPLLLAQEFDATILSPLQVAPIHIDELGVKLLAEETLQ